MTRLSSGLTLQRHEVPNAPSEGHGSAHRREVRQQWWDGEMHACSRKVAEMTGA